MCVGNADDAVDKLNKLFTNSRVADKEEVIVAPCNVDRSQHALTDVTVRNVYTATYPLIPVRPDKIGPIGCVV